MQVDSKLKIALPENDKMHLMCDVDSPLGMIYDFVCGLKGYIAGKIQEAEAAAAQQAPPAAPAAPEQPQVVAEQPAAEV